MTHPGVQKNRARSSSLFLMELILAILFFSVASAVCVQFFVKSHLLSLDSSVLTHAVNESSGAAEILTTADSLADGLSLLQNQYPMGKYPDLNELSNLVKSLAPADILTETSGAIQIYYDESFSPCAEASAAYILDIQIAYSGQMMDVTFRMYKAGALAQDDASDISSTAASNENQSTPIYQLKTKHHIARRTDDHER